MLVQTVVIFDFQVQVSHSAVPVSDRKIPVVGQGEPPRVALPRDDRSSATSCDA